MNGLNGTSQSGVRVAYDEVADSFADHFRATEAETALDLAMISHFVAALRGDRRVLDAGCGAGRMLPHLAGLGCAVEGVDLSPGMIRRARTDHPEFRTTVASITDLPHPDAVFDGVFSWYSTIHGDDAALAESLAEFRRVLRPDGLALLGFQTGTAVMDVSGPYRRIGHEIVLARHQRTPDQVAAAAAATGLVEEARMARAAGPEERDGQAVLILRTGRRGDRSRPSGQITSAAPNGAVLGGSGERV